MEMKQLEAFANVIKYQSFTKAAQAMFLTQPTVSAHISSLERELDVQLIVRTTKEVRASKVGQVFYRYAQQMLELRDKSIDAVKGFEADMNATITIAASGTPANYFLPKPVSEFSTINPSATFNILNGDSATVIEHIATQRADIGVVGSLIPHKKCIFEQFATDKLVIISPNTPRHVALGKSRGAMTKLLSEPFISRELGSGTRRETDHLLREANFEPSRLNIIADFQDNESIIRSVAQGLGVSVVSSCAAEESRRFGKILVFPIGPSTKRRPLFLVRSKISSLSPASNAFYRFALKYFCK